MKRTDQFETEEARELHARIQAMEAIQKARGDTAKWLEENRLRFWREDAPLFGMLSVICIIASIVLFPVFRGRPFTGHFITHAIIALMAWLRYPRAH